MRAPIPKAIFTKCLALWQAAAASAYGIAVASDNRATLRYYLYATRQLEGGFEELMITPVKDKENELWITRAPNE